MPEHHQRGELWTTTGRNLPIPRPGPPRREHDQAAIEADVRNYQQLHRQKRQNATTRLHRVARDETESFLAFADIWAPFGGPPEAELFVTYGITKSTFFERLRQIITSRKCDRSIAQRLSAAYPPLPSHPAGHTGERVHDPRAGGYLATGT